MNPINKPVMKLATKGTLDTRAIIPNGARRPTNSVILVVIESKLILTVPAYAKIIKAIAIMWTNVTLRLRANQKASNGKAI